MSGWNDRSTLRLFVLRVLVLSLLVTLFGRLWYLQVLAGPQYAQAAADNRTREIVTQPTRGQILDDYGRPLVSNQTALVVSVDRSVLSHQPDGGAAVLHRLAGVLGLPYQELVDRTRLCSRTVPAPCWNGSPYQPIPVDDNPGTRQAMQILERQEDFPGVSADVQTIRSYPMVAHGVSAAHLLGYLGPISDAELAKLSPTQRADQRNSLVGRSGLEAFYEKYLRGVPGVRTVAVDHLGDVTGVVGERPPVPGDTLVTSLDANLQGGVEAALAHAITNAHSQGQVADSAAAVVLDARTGHVLAMASYPTYNPQVWAGGRISQADYKHLTDPKAGDPLLDRAVAGEYAPGSTFKLISTSGLVMDGIANLYGTYECSSSYTIRGQVFHNFEGEFLGALSLHTTIVKSCDTVYYRLAYADWKRDQALIAQHKPPVEGVQHMARAFGLGSPTGVDLPTESAGFIDDRATKLRQWKQFYRPNACKGARNPAFPADRRAFDADICRYGYIYNPGDQANFDIGQGTVLVTPLQLAAAYCALINGGIVYSPRIGKALISPSGQVLQHISAPVRGHVPVSPTVLSYIENAMYDVTRTGTASGTFQGFPFAQVNVGGKTGTAQVSNKGDTSVFASFAGPAGQPPRYVAVVFVPQAGQGALVAGPAVREIWDRLFGLEGQHAALPGGLPPQQLPTFTADGTVAPPPVPRPRPGS